MLRLTLSSYGANPVGLDNIVIEPPGSVSGDPHFVTFDGKHYGLQKSGEFTLAKSTDAGDFFSIQVLTSPGRAGRQ
ncbi:MAG TPA: VWD domain-containing protein [Stellaceae bacterium]|nr:VWD domain-containing protein [Stellaceae bacterium]